MRKGIKSRDDELVTLIHPKSIASEAYRTLRTNISFLSPDKPLRSIVFTSGGPAEGKSLTVANLGISFAQDGKKIIIIDGDLRKPMQNRFFKIPNFEGLTNILTGETKLDEVIQDTSIEGLKILTTGICPPNPTELLGSKKMEKLLEEIQEEADMIFIDMPPVIAVSDALVLANRADGVILIVAAHETPKEVLTIAQEKLDQVKANIIGVVMTKYPIQAKDRYYSYYYYGG